MNRLWKKKSGAGQPISPSSPSKSSSAASRSTISQSIRARVTTMMKKKQKTPEYISHENEISTISKHQEQILKNLNRVTKSSRALSNDYLSLAESMKDYGHLLMDQSEETGADNRLGISLLKFARMIVQLEQARSDHDTEVVQQLSNPLSNFLKEEYSNTKADISSHEIASVKLVSAEKNLEAAKKGKQQVKLLEAEEGKATALVDYHSTYKIAMESMEALIEKNRGDIMNRFCDYMAGQLTLAERNLSTLEPINDHSILMRQKAQESALQIKQRKLDKARQKFEADSTEYSKMCHTLAHHLISHKLELISCLTEASPQLTSVIIRNFFRIHEVYGNPADLTLLIINGYMSQLAHLNEKYPKCYAYEHEIFLGLPLHQEILTQYLSSYCSPWIAKTLHNTILTRIIAPGFKTVFEIEKIDPPDVLTYDPDDPGNMVPLIAATDLHFNPHEFRWTSKFVEPFTELLNMLLDDIIASADSIPEHLISVLQSIRVLDSNKESLAKTLSSKFARRKRTGSFLVKSRASTDSVSSHDSNSPKDPQAIALAVASSVGSSAPSPSSPQSSQGPSSDSAPSSPLASPKSPNSSLLSPNSSSSLAVPSMNSHTTSTQDIGVNKVAQQEKIRNLLGNFLFSTIWLPAISHPNVFRLYSCSVGSFLNKFQSPPNLPFSPPSDKIHSLLFLIKQTLFHAFTGNFFPKTSKLSPLNKFIESNHKRIMDYIDKVASINTSGTTSFDFVIPSNSDLHKSKKTFFSVSEATSFEQAKEIVNFNDCPQLAQLISSLMKRLADNMNHYGFQSLLDLLPELLAGFRRLEGHIDFYHNLGNS